MNTELALGIDLGGTRIKAVAINKAGEILHQIYMPTNDGKEDASWKEAVATAVKELKKLVEHNDIVIGISAPGLPNASNTHIAYMPGRLQGLEKFNWGELLQTKTFVLNDAVAALMAEANYGVAKGYKNVAMITLGTGVGGAILINGKPYQGNFQKAGHIGHMVIDSDGDPDVTGMPGSLEEAIGNYTVEKRSNGRFLETHSLLKAYRQGDDDAKSVWLTSIKKLALGVASVTNILSPDCIIIGGGMIAAGDDLFNPLEKFLEQYEWRAGGNKTKILKAGFGDLAGAAGAAGFAMMQKEV